MKNLFFFSFMIILIASCGKGPETVTIQTDTSTLLAQADTTSLDDSTEEDDFVHVKIGEIAPIKSLDPLFATSNSEFRILTLIYDRLLHLNEEGDPSPALAKTWTINEDSTQFTFQLRNDVLYHNAEVFSSNTGRKVTAHDVQYVFERMGQDNVPHFASRHFKNITGFEAFQNERVFVKDPDQRVISSIRGIQVSNDSTITFFLNRPSSTFLRKLAHPRASIYPEESTPASSGPIQKPAGTGPFRYVQTEGTTLILAINKKYIGNTPEINRLDVISGAPERNLFQAFARNELDALIELGPASLLTVADSAGNLLSSYYLNYELKATGVHSKYQFFYNTQSYQGHSVNALLERAEDSRLLTSPALGTIQKYIVSTDSTEAISRSQLATTHTEHPFELYLLNNLAPIGNDLGYSFSMSASYAINDVVAFTTRPYSGTALFLEWKAPLYILHHEGISGIVVDQAPWNLDLSSLEKNQGN